MTIEVPSISKECSHISSLLPTEDDPSGAGCIISDSSSTNDDSIGTSCSSSDLEQLNETITTSSLIAQPLPRLIGVVGNTHSSTSTMKFRHERNNSGQIRSKLLLKLGIEKGYTRGNTTTSTEASRVVQQGQDDAFTVALKYDYGQIDDKIEKSKHPITTLATSPGNNHIIEKNTKRDHVCFDASVTVHPIPARSDYSKRMRSVMWVSSTEIQQNAARNSLEFAAEEWDVSKVVDDEDMIVYCGERIHPIHFIQMESDVPKE